MNNKNYRENIIIFSVNLGISITSIFLKPLISVTCQRPKEDYPVDFYRLTVSITFFILLSIYLGLFN